MNTKEIPSWKIPGLIFGRLTQEFEQFCLAKTGLPPQQLTREQMEIWLPGYEQQILNDSLKAGYDRYPDFYKACINNQDTISKRVEDSFRYFFSYLNAMSSIYARLNEAIGEGKLPRNYQFIFPLYGMLLRLADQVGILLLNGYPDGAIRIWRSLYEFSQVTLLFIQEVENEPLQKKFMEHFHRSQRKKTESFQKHHEALNHPALDVSFIEHLTERVNQFNALYGKDFLDDEYGWCSDLFQTNKRVTLRDIEERVGLTRFRPFYIYACGYTHPGFSAMLDFFEQDEQKLKLREFDRQTTNPKAFIDPMQLTIAMLHEVNILFLQLYSFPGQEDLNITLLRNIFESLINTFHKMDASGSSAH